MEIFVSRECKEFVEMLVRNHVKHEVRQMAQGTEVKIIQPSWNGHTVSYRIFP